MTDIASGRADAPGTGRLAGAISDSAALIGRHMRQLKRTPEQLITLTLMPAVFVIVFGFLFGSAMQVPGDMKYQEYIMAGIFVQVVLGNVGLTAMGVVSDLDNGLMDRFRSLPISRTAVLIGRTTSDVAVVAWSFLLMSVIGFAIGWRTHEGFLSMLAGFGLLLLLAFATSWLGALLGLVLRNASAVNGVSAVVVMPMSFLSNAYIPLDGLPGWMQGIAGWNPVSSVVLASRKLFGNAAPTSAHQTFPLQHPVPMALILTGALIAIAVPLATRAFEKSATKK
ncbi:ABC transporter permease [Kitasatospora sp. A2-31]|uniref:ABC transporter permease n=1 Tax=Kitasatospora sp. A2-31 TaxID=2916414 RepID=UPI001EEB8DB3|nr:ABC transporter permease [Kitasatospora sp. A2-31]MCG6495242.1 ABC transporter permease [Kitasatospora sp. A2-31]